MRTIWQPARPGDTPGGLVPGEGDVPVLNPCAGALRALDLARGRLRLGAIRRGWPGPTVKRRRARRPDGVRRWSRYR